MLLMENLTISARPFSIAMLNYQKVTGQTQDFITLMGM